MHPLKALRQRSSALLSAAGIAVDINGQPVAVSVFEHPPTGGWVAADKLPAIFCYVRSEVIEAGTYAKDQRGALLDVVLQAKGGRDDVLDQLDDIHLAMEIAFASDFSLGGLLYRFRPTGSEIYTNQGEVVFAARRVTYEAQLMVPRADPTVPS